MSSYSWTRPALRRWFLNFNLQWRGQTGTPPALCRWFLNFDLQRRGQTGPPPALCRWRINFGLQRRLTDWQRVLVRNVCRWKLKDHRHEIDEVKTGRF